MTTSSHSSTSHPLKISVILPNYNYACYVKSRLNQIMTQTYPIYELIILDDASNDNSIDVINSSLKQLRQDHPDLHIKTQFNRHNSGNVFSQWQKGIKLATGDYLWICELDDIARPTFLEATLKSFNSSAVILSYTNSRIIDQDDRFPIIPNLRRLPDFYRRRHLPGNYTADGLVELNRNLAIYNSIPNVSAVVFRNTPQLLTLLDQAKTYRLSGDWFFYLNLAPQGQISYYSKPLNYHRVHSGSVTSQTNLQDRFAELCQIHQYAINHFDLLPQTQKRIQHSEQYLSRRWHLPQQK